MNKFYNLLVKESLVGEDVLGLARDNVKDCHEIEQAFKTSNSCHLSYLYRTTLEICCTIAMVALFALHYDDIGIGAQNAFFDCDVEGKVINSL